jgi:hypothetical protein
MSPLQRVAVSMPLAESSVDPETFVPMFHDWIRRGAVEGTLIDVARYGHVHHGPGIMLIGHEGDYSIDQADGRLALRYTVKRDNDGAPYDVVERALRRLSLAADALAAAGTSVDTATVTVRIYDRLRAPNTAESREQLIEPIGAAVREVLNVGETDPEVVSDDPREPLGLRFGAGVAPVDGLGTSTDEGVAHPDQ